MAASILSNQATGAGLGVAGVAREDIWLGQTVQFSDAGLGGVSWAWEFVFGPPGYTNTFSDPTISDPTWDPDVPGSYLVQLTQNPGEPDETVQRRVFRVRKTAAGVEDDVSVNYGLCLPAPEECDLQGAQEANYSGNTRGWDATWIPIFNKVVAHETTLRGLSTTTTDLAADIAAIEAQLATKDWKDSVDLASTGPVILAGGAQTVDGTSVGGGTAYSVLVKDQAAGEQNGIYDAPAGGGAWVRRSDADTSAKVTCGMAVRVEGGTDNVGTAWYLSTPDPIVLGTTALTFAEFGGGSIDNPWLTVDQVIQDSGLTGFSIEAASLLDLSSSGGDAMLRAPAGNAFVGGLSVDIFSDSTYVAESTTTMEWFAGSTMLFDSVGVTTLKSSQLKVQIGAAVDHHVFEEKWVTLNKAVFPMRVGAWNDGSGAYANTAAIHVGTAAAAPTPLNASARFDDTNTIFNTPTISGLLYHSLGGYAAMVVQQYAGTGTRFDFYDVNANALAATMIVDSTGYASLDTSASTSGFNIVAAAFNLTSAGAVQASGTSLDARFTGVAQLKANTQIDLCLDDLTVSHRFEDRWATFDRAGTPVRIGTYHTGLTAYCGIYFNQASPGAFNYGFLGDSNDTYINAGSRTGLNELDNGGYPSFKVQPDATKTRFSFFDNYGGTAALLLDVDDAAANLFTMGQWSTGTVWVATTPTTDMAAGMFAFLAPDATTFATATAAYKVGGSIAFKVGRGRTPGTDAPGAFRFGLGDEVGGVTDIANGLIFGTGAEQNTRGAANYIPYTTEKGRLNVRYDRLAFNIGLLISETSASPLYLYSNDLNQYIGVGNTSIQMFVGSTNVLNAATIGTVSMAAASTWTVQSVSYSRLYSTSDSVWLYAGTYIRNMSTNRLVVFEGTDGVERYRFRYPADVVTTSTAITNLLTLTLAAAGRPLTVEVRFASYRAALPGAFTVMRINLENPTGAAVDKIGETIDESGDTTIAAHSVAISGSSIIFRTQAGSASSTTHSVTVTEIT